ncbi:hypothetical protein HHK36_025028 [Tetracentron sinense]|uniref:Uncharacterized protein n=1 Tax=Tetracentron sinense TaxID=13715 RepID=A0A834YRV8_TETSI|nr:hypothetical protein HHK36_025028 [Tetracentron sinense]
METETMFKKERTVEMSSNGVELAAPLTRQSSAAKTHCLCSPTTHAGSFRCRLHRSPTLHRSKSMDSATAPVLPPKDTNGNRVEAQTIGAV